MPAATTEAECGDETLPEAIFWLLLTKDVPSAEQTKMVTNEWNGKGELPDYVEKKNAGLFSLATLFNIYTSECD